MQDFNRQSIFGHSMGGHGAFTIGWSQPGLFGSIASHMGALSLPPLAGTQEDQARNAGEVPIGRAPSASSPVTRVTTTCSRLSPAGSAERIEAMLGSFSPAERADMVEPDGNIHVKCEYCGRNYEIAPEASEA